MRCCLLPSMSRMDKGIQSLSSLRSIIIRFRKRLSQERRRRLKIFGLSNQERILIEGVGSMLSKLFKELRKLWVQVGKDSLKDLTLFRNI